MKTKALLIASVTSLLMACEPAPSTQTASQAESSPQSQHTLTIKLSNISKPEGNIKLFVYRTSDDLLRGQASYLQQTYSLEQAAAPIVLNQVPTGDYAIFVLQDLDDDHKLAMNHQGMPQEPYGYSNNPVLMGPPTMAQVQFSLNQDKTAEIKMN
ncbi:DUF2141 domain-containing protein [Motilimonas eburnea]|uniref:DUF2141 domain-containing protein n=1 Tax=Motilimonas eburnea TaxID=1737488 RepID=UPI001E418F79|nr:DUF2141 domain-containing protein [Motilimonas eburnea]MCE2569867.1 DUF2141 domain-containing protein [Motilimonas eburnea]